jgi:hypothetical protein
MTSQVKNNSTVLEELSVFNCGFDGRVSSKTALATVKSTIGTRLLSQNDGITFE